MNGNVWKNNSRNSCIVNIIILCTKQAKNVFKLAIVMALTGFFAIIMLMEMVVLA